MSESDLVELRKQCITSLYLCTDNVCKYMDEEKEAEFNKLKKYVGEYCLLEAQEEVAIQALEKAKVIMLLYQCHIGHSRFKISIYF